MAYKSVEIDETLLKNEIEYIRKHRYSVLENISNHYDFGLLYMDCTPVKNVVIDHCIALEKEISQYVLNEFIEKMRNVT
jgi:hypothetical protein